jgi:elongation factor Ts
VQSLRQSTGVGMMDAKRALTETGGDMDKAKDLLREKGLADVKKRAGRDANSGTVGVYTHALAGYPTVGVLIELASETDFVARNDDFQNLAKGLAMHIAASQPRWVTIEDVPEDALAKERELIEREAIASGKPEAVAEKIVEGKVGSFYKDYVLYEQTYIKTDDYEGKVGEMVGAMAVTMGENISVRRFSRIAVGEHDL